MAVLCLATSAWSRVPCQLPPITQQTQRALAHPDKALRFLPTQTTTQGTKLGRTFLVQPACASYPGGIPQLAEDLQNAIKQGVSCLQRTSPQRQQDALQLMALFQQTPAPLPIQCVADSTEEVADDTVIQSVVACGVASGTNYTASLQANLKNLQKPFKVASPQERKLAWFHEFFHLINYSHNRAYDVPYLSQWCCFGADPTQRKQACDVLTNENKLSVADLMKTTAFLFQADQHPDLALWAPWQEFMFQQTHNNRWETLPLVQALIATTTFESPAVQAVLEEKQKTAACPIKDAPDPACPYTMLLDGKEVTLRTIRALASNPYLALILSYVGLQADPATSTHPEWHERVEAELANVFFPSTEPDSQPKRELAHASANAFAPLAFRRASVSEKAIKMLSRVVSSTCHALNEEERKQFQWLLIEGEHQLIHWAEDVDAAAGAQPPLDFNAILTRWRGLVERCDQSKPPVPVHARTKQKPNLSEHKKKSGPL